MEHHGHSHGRARPFCRASKTCRLSTVLCLIIGYFFVELIAGYLLHSVALNADAIHMLSDAGALIIAMVSLRISKRKSAKNTFGWVRAQELGAMVNCILLISLCFTIFVQAIKRLIMIEPVDREHLNFYMIVGGIGLLINIMSMVILGSDLSHSHSHGGGGHGHSHGHSHDGDGGDHGHSDGHRSKAKRDNGRIEDDLEVGEHEHLCADESIGTDGSQPHAHHGHSHGPPTTQLGSVSVFNGETNNDATQSQKKQKKKKGLDGSQMNIRGAFVHVLSDALGSVIVILAGLAIKTWPDSKWVNYVDPVASLIMISMILAFAIPLLRESALVLLQTAPTHIEVQVLQRSLLDKVPGILGVHEFHVWQLSGTKVIASAHIRCKNLSEYMNIAQDVKAFFHEAGIHSTTIQPEFSDVDVVPGTVSDKECILECLEDCSVKTCCGQLSNYVKQRQPGTSVPTSVVDAARSPQSEMAIPSIEIIAPSRSNSFVE